MWCKNWKKEYRIWSVLSSSFAFTKVYKDLGYKLGSMPNAEYLSERTLAIPVDPELTEEERSYIVDILNNIGE